MLLKFLSIALIAVITLSAGSLPLTLQDAHTNYQVIPLDQQDLQKVDTVTPLSEIKLRPQVHNVGVRILSLPSDQVELSSDKFARFAIAMNEAPPQGAEIVAHTNIKLAGKGATPSLVPLSLNGHIINNSPSEIVKRYGLPASGSPALIVVVDAHHYPTAEVDLAKFSLQFGLPTCSVKSGCLQIIKVDPVRTLPDTDARLDDCGWSVEAALDLQWAHAINPQAKLILVEAVSKSATDLFQAVAKATELAESAGGGIVSLSWSFDEVNNESTYDGHFLLHDSVLYFAASGDSGGTVEYPAASPYVISVGGTDVLRDGNNIVQAEEGWDLSGGGTSKFEVRPLFQGPLLENFANTQARVIPDISGPAGIDRNLVNGSPIYAGTVCRPYTPGWYAAGGTSLSTPIIAAAVSLSFGKGGKTETVLENIYNQRKNKSAVKDITLGKAGQNYAVVGYDAVTGVGVPSSNSFALPPTHP